jgi:hypothetical protein
VRKVRRGSVNRPSQHKRKPGRHAAAVACVRSLELGATWLHGSIGNPLYEFAAAAGLFRGAQGTTEFNGMPRPDDSMDSPAGARHAVDSDAPQAQNSCPDARRVRSLRVTRTFGATRTMTDRRATYAPAA